MVNVVNDIKTLRERTGAGMMECKKALVESNGDIEKAIEALRKSGLAKAYKKASRIAAEGLVNIKIENDTAAMVEINCETDFVARDENFKNFVQIVLDTIHKDQTDDLEKIKQLKFSANGSTIEELRAQLVSKVGENICIRRAKILKGDKISTYLHGGRIGVLVRLNDINEILSKDLAMHIAASRPLVINASDLPSEIVKKEKEIITEQVRGSGCPADKVDRQVESQIKKFCEQASLLGQLFVKDPKTTVGKLLKDHSAEVIEFVRFEVGEGIDKQEAN